MNDDPDTHCEPLPSQQVEKSLLEAKRYHQAGLSSGVAEAAPL